MAARSAAEIPVVVPAFASIGMQNAVPNRAVRLDRNLGKAYVTRLVDDEPVQYEVQLGARTDTMSEILAGVQGGDVLIIGDVSRVQRLQQGLFGQ